MPAKSFPAGRTAKMKRAPAISRMATGTILDMAIYPIDDAGLHPIMDCKPAMGGKFAYLSLDYLPPAFPRQ